MQSPDSDDEGSSYLSRRNMILAGASVVVALSLPKNSLASTPLSTTDQPSKNNDGNDNNMNSTTDTRETAHTLTRSTSPLYLRERLKTCTLAKSSAHPAAHLPMRTLPPSRPFRLTITLFTTTWS